MKELTFWRKNGIESMTGIEVKITECFIVVLKRDLTQEIFTPGYFDRLTIREIGGKIK